MWCMFLTFPSWPLGRADPECVLGHLLKILFKNDDFMNTVRMDGTEFTLFSCKIKVHFFPVSVSEGDLCFLFLPL